jgi:hypothetical protein
MATLNCAYCGNASNRLDDAEHCPVCRLYHLAADEMGINQDLNRIGDAIRAALVDGFAHPDDIREHVEAVLQGADGAEEAKGRQRMRDVAPVVEAQMRSLRAAVV